MEINTGSGVSPLPAMPPRFKILNPQDPAIQRFDFKILMLLLLPLLLLLLLFLNIGVRPGLFYGRFANRGYLCTFKTLVYALFDLQ